MHDTPSQSSTRTVRASANRAGGACRGLPALVAALWLGFVLAPSGSLAQTKADTPKAPSGASAPRTAGTAQPTTPGASAPNTSAVPIIAARSWLLIDVTSGQVLASHEPDMRIDPASLTKLMTAHLVFAALEEKRLSLDQRPPVSRAAWRSIGSRMFVDPAKPATIEELLNGMIVQSGNDASVILAEAIAGSESGFAELMNREAKRLGMNNTQWRNATGLPDPQHYSTARDLATLALQVISGHPVYFPLYSKKEYTYNNIRQPNRNRLLFVDPSVDGLKTGHTEAAGYCLIATARRDQGGGFQRRLLSVVLGASSESVRAIETQKLLNWGFQNFEAVRVQAADKPTGEYRVWKGTTESVEGAIEKDLIVTVARGQGERVKGEVERIHPLVAPIASGERIGSLRVRIGDEVVAERPVLARAAVDQAGWIRRIWDSIRMMFAK
jgi:serine-type D-Ala-D-Ala carboxypeptidase (penicillin-binding protein 5/6)